MEHTIDEKIAQLKHEGMISIPQENSLANLPIIESIVFETKPYKLFAEDSDQSQILQEWANEGGCRSYDV